jgi:large subunit ribosomal protein L24
MKTETKYEVKCRLKKGDEVIVLTGKSKGETGKVDRIDKKAGRVFVGGVNIYKRHTKPGGASEGGIVDKVMSMHISNVALYDSKAKKASRIGYKVEGDKKVRVSKASGQTLS